MTARDVVPRDIETLQEIAKQDHLTLEDVNRAREAYERCQKEAGPLNWRAFREAKALWDAIAGRFTAG